MAKGDKIREQVNASYSKDQLRRQLVEAEKDALTPQGLKRRFKDLPDDLELIPGGLLLPSAHMKDRILHPRQLEEYPLKPRDTVLVSSEEESASKINKFAFRLGEYCQSQASQQRLEYDTYKISYGLTELFKNATLHGQKFSGKPICISWEISPAKSHFTVVDSGKEDFNPYKYAKMDVSEYENEIKEGECAGHAGITVLVGRDPIIKTAEEETEGLFKRHMLKYTPIVVGGKREGTKVDLTIYSKPKSQEKR